MVADGARAPRLALLGIDEHEVDVGGNVELRPAQLAHPDHVQLLDAAAFRADRRAVLLAEPCVEADQRVG